MADNDTEIVKHAGGRPTVMTDIVLKKLEEAFAVGASDREAIFYAGISLQTLYDYQKRVPEFVERKAELKQRPILQARRTVVAAIQDDPKTAMWYLERKKKDEFAAKSEIDMNLDITGRILQGYGLLEEGKTNDTKIDGSVEESSQDTP